MMDECEWFDEDECECVLCGKLLQNIPLKLNLSIPNPQVHPYSIQNKTHLSHANPRLWRRNWRVLSPIETTLLPCGH